MSESAGRPSPGREARDRSLAARLAIAFTLAAFALVVLVTGSLYVVLERFLGEVTQHLAADEISILREVLRERPGDLSAIRQEVEFESGARSHASIFKRVLDAGDSVLMETPGFPSDLGVTSFLAGREFPDLARVLARDSQFGLFSSRVALDGETQASVTIQVAIDRSEARAVLGEFRSRSLLILPLALLASALGAYFIARRGLRPLERVAHVAAQTRAGALDQRIVLRGLPSELQVVARGFNEMLDRLAASFLRLDRFSVDIAHELRTPVGILRGEIEVALSRDREPDEYREILESCLEESARLSRLIDELLFIARSDGETAPGRQEPLDPGAEIDSIVQYYEALASESGLSLTARCAPGVEIFASRALFQRAVANLIENAIAYTPAGGAVTAEVRAEDDHACVVVEDTGRGIPAGDMPHVFERMRRGPGVSGHGLGLSIVQSIVKMHRGRVDISSEVDRGTRVELRFPLSHASGGSSRERLSS